MNNTIRLSKKYPKVFPANEVNPSGDIIFSVQNGLEILKLCGNGNILVKGKLVTKDLEVVEALKDFILEAKQRPILG